MTEQTALSTPQETAMTRVKNYMLSPEVKERFTEMMGSNGIYYLNQVLILVSNNYNLQECEPKSILISAMRAASLKLSVDQAQGQAWIIPYKNSKTGRKEATFQLGYKGVYELAMRTNLYRFINVIDIYEGEEITENRMTGIHAINGQRTSSKVIARMLYFQLFNGFEKTFVMTVDEIEAHAKKYSRGYNNSDSKWHDPHERPKMERKTVLMNGLRKWGRFNVNDAAVLDEIESEQAWIDPNDQLPEESAVTVESEPAPRPADTVLSELYGDAPAKPAPTPEPAKPAATPAPASQTNRQLIKVSPTYSCPKAWIDAVVAKWGAQKVNGFEAGKIFEKLNLDAEMSDEVATGAAGAYLIVRKQDPPGTTEEAVESANGYIVACLNGMTENG